MGVAYQRLKFVRAEPRILKSVFDTPRRTNSLDAIIASCRALARGEKTVNVGGMRPMSECAHIGMKRS
jgi:hypothetical protein